MMKTLRRLVAPLALAGTATLGVAVIDAPPIAAAPASVSARAYVTPGAFCSSNGAVGYTKTNVKMTCSYKDGDSRLRWRQAPVK